MAGGCVEGGKARAAAGRAQKTRCGAGYVRTYGALASGLSRARLVMGKGRCLGNWLDGPLRWTVPSGLEAAAVPAVVVGAGESAPA